MDWKFDPTLSSAEYLALARKRSRYSDVPHHFGWMLNRDSFDFSVHRRHVDELLDRGSWSASVLLEGRRPRVFIDAYWNQSGNVEIRSIGGQSHRLYFEQDFAWSFLDRALAGHYGAHRSVGEIMWMKGFADLRVQAVYRKSPVAKALLFGFKARLDELIREVSAEIDVVGCMEMQFQYERKNVAAVDFVPNVSLDQIRAWQEELFG